MARVECVCKTCGGKFTERSSRVKNGRGKFCSRQCLGQWFSKYRRGENHPRWSQTERECEICGTKFVATPYRIEKGHARFCSIECQGKWQSSARSGENHPNWQGGKVKRQCERCGKTVEAFPSRIKAGRGRFCSTECMVLTVGENQRGEGNPNWNRIDFECEQCGKTMKVVPHLLSLGKRFCSKECYGRSIRGENHHNWQGGGYSKPYPEEFNGSLKEQIRGRDDFLCQICGEPEAEYNHHVHHIDYDKTNNDPVNLITLCVSCHGKTNVERGYWQDRLSRLVIVKYYEDDEWIRQYMSRVAQEH